MLGLFPHKHPKGICPDGKNPRGQKPTALYETLTTDEELLADQGPMLIIHSDGRKQLLLTRPR
jgi:hypothetical protein